MSHKRQDPEFFDPFGKDDLEVDPPSREHARPSIAEVQLIRHERRKPVPSLPPPAAEEENDPRTAAQITAALCDRKDAELRATLF